MNEVEKENTFKKTTLGLEENIEGVLCYCAGFLSGFIMLLLERESKFVRFHAMQSIAVFLLLLFISVVFNAIPLISVFVSWIPQFAGIFIWLFLMYKAYQGEKYMFPKAGEFAKKQVGG